MTAMEYSWAGNAIVARSFILFREHEKTPKRFSNICKSNGMSISTSDTPPPKTKITIPSPPLNFCPGVPS